MSQPIEAIYENGVFRPLDPVDLPESSYATVLPHARLDDSPGSSTSIEDRLAALGAQISEAEWQKLPADLSDRLDEYLYGSSR